MLSFLFSVKSSVDWNKVASLSPSLLPSWDPADQAGLRAEVGAPDSGLIGPLPLSRQIITGQTVRRGDKTYTHSGKSLHVHREPQQLAC